MFCQRCGHTTREQPVDGRMRPVCTSCGAVVYLDPKLAVAVVIVQDQRVLLGRRASHTRAPGEWSFPAGFVERGEVVESAAIRETREETGLEIIPGPVLALLSTEGETVVLAVYAAQEIGGSATPGDDLTELRWWPLDDLPPLAFDHDLEIIALWRRASADAR